MAIDQYAGIRLLSALPTWLNEDDGARLAAYELYEKIYWTAPETFKLVQRGSEEQPLYLPTGRIICNTMNRYVGKGWSWSVNPEFGSDAEKQLTAQVMKALFTRERFSAKFTSNKLYGVIRGDWCWYLTADPEKPEGSRISINALDPSNYFPIKDPDDDHRILGVDIVEQFMLNEAQVVKRQRYLKSDHPDHPAGNGVAGGDISYQVDTFELEGWETPEAKVVAAGQNVPAEVLPGITTLPVYHIRNFETPGDWWGSSEMRGIEMLFANINQTISDESLSLALEGLGLYYTDAGAPVDEEGNEQPWGLGPGQVVEVGTGKTFNRVDGVSTVDPSQKHIEKLEDSAYRVSGASDVAQGTVDVTVAESGIALQLRMGPILDTAAVKDEFLKSTMDQMLHDLRTWLRVYEGQNLDNVVLESSLPDKLPQDNASRFRMLLEGYSAMPPLWSGQYVRDECRKMGMDIPANMLQDIVDEQAAFAEFSDPYGARAEEEAEEDEA